VSISVDAKITVLSPFRKIRKCIVLAVSDGFFTWQQVNEPSRRSSRSFAEEGITWIRGHHAYNSKKVSAMRVAKALESAT